MHSGSHAGAPPTGSRIASRVLPWLVPASLAAVLVARCALLSAKRLMNTDELFTWYPVSAPFHAMLASTTDTINASPPLYFLVAWDWASIFGNSALSLRLLSSLAAASALLMLFTVMRRAYGALAASAALTVAFFDPELLFQTADARFYAVLLAEVALGVLLYQRMLQLRRPPASLLAANAAVHAALVMTHYFGLLYSGVILGGVLLTGLSRRRSTLPAALSIVAGWVVFLPWIPVFRRHQSMGKPTFWISVPTPADLRDYFAHFVAGDFGLLVAVLAAFAVAAAFLARRGRTKLWAVRVREAPLLILAVLFGLVPFVVFLVSTRAGSVSVFLSRYMTPCAIGWAILCAHISNRAFGLARRIARRGAARALIAAQALAVLLFAGRCGWNVLDSARNEIPQELPRMLPSTMPLSEPVVVESIHDFMRLHFYSPEPERYLFLVDREAAVRIGGANPSNHEIIESLKRRFPAQFTEVVPYGPFLDKAESFWVKIHDLRWSNVRLGHDSPFVADSMIPKLELVHEHRRN